MNPNQGNSNMYNTQLMNQYVDASLKKSLPDQKITSLYNHHHHHQSKIGDSVLALKKSDSCLTYNLPNTPRKRSRESFTHESVDYSFVPQKFSKCSDFSSSFIGNEEIYLQTEIEQLEIDRIISLHAEKLKFELNLRRKRQFRLLVSAAEETMVKKLKEKEEQLQRIRELNWVLQEKIKTLFFENQLWRDLAQSNEATANNLRNNLEQLLAHVSTDRRAAEDDDAESCNSNNSDQERWRMCGGGCRICGERESSILLLPCRHLCICTSCGSTIHTCPVCNSNITASLHVNMS